MFDAVGVRKPAKIRGPDFSSFQVLSETSRVGHVEIYLHGGGWGYSASSVEAVRFSPDTDVLLGGFGLYGGRGTYNADIKVIERSKYPPS